jgi:hypothetical protein
VSQEYRVKAAEFAAQARREADPAKRAQLENLERSYLRLAMQADKNAGTDVVYETPPQEPVMQQQQQRQAKKDPET